MDKFSKAIFIIIAVSLIGINIQLFNDNKINLISESKAEVAGMDYIELKEDEDFHKGVRRVVERYCYVSNDYIFC